MAFREKVRTIDDFLEYQSQEYIDEIRYLAEPFHDERLWQVNSTSDGGGVNVLLDDFEPIFQSIGIDTQRYVLKSVEDDFWALTTNFHNILQGEDGNNIDELIDKYKFYYGHRIDEYGRRTMIELGNTGFIDSIIDGEGIYVIHDPQPLGLIRYKELSKNSKWIWRTHIDTSHPNRELWKFVLELAEKYDAIVATSREYMPGDYDGPLDIIQPSINPFSSLNREMDSEEAQKILQHYDIPLDKPIVSQVSRFDIWKDPIGVIKSWRMSKSNGVDTSLVLLGSSASDNVEGEKVYREVLKEAEHGKFRQDIYVVNKRDANLVNALQRESDVILQKSLREGFGLTVAEALWKKTPVIASDVGGIPYQVISGAGFLVNPEDYIRVAELIGNLIEEPHMRKQMGEIGHIHIRDNFLTTRHVKDYLQLFRRTYGID